MLRAMSTKLRGRDEKHNVILLFGQQTELARSLSWPRNSHINRRKKGKLPTTDITKKLT